MWVRRCVEECALIKAAAAGGVDPDDGGVHHHPTSFQLKQRRIPPSQTQTCEHEPANEIRVLKMTFKRPRLKSAVQETARSH